jgi:exonuclease III
VTALLQVWQGYLRVAGPGVNSVSDDNNMSIINAKKHSFCNFLDSSNPDIICGNETWFKPSICNSEILPDESDYEIFRKDRKDGFGGVMLVIKSTINSNSIDITTVTDCDCEIIPKKIECDSNKSLIVISAYRPPNSSIEKKFVNFFTILVAG